MAVALEARRKFSSSSTFSFDRFLALRSSGARGRRRTGSQGRDEALNGAIAMRDDSKVDWGA
jgi:hypothetical protein